MTDGQTATVTATDAAKNTSATDTVIGGKDTIAPNAPDAVINTDGTVVSGKAEPNSSIEVKDAAGKVIGTGTTDASGNFSVNVSPAVTDGQTATVTATDAAKNTSATDTVIGGKDTIAPNAPQLMLDEDTGIGGDGITSNGIINVSNLEENAIWQYSIDGGNTWKFGTGNSFMLAEGIYLQDLVQVKQTDLAGNSAITTMAPMVIDKTAPSLTIDDVLTNVSKPIITGTVEDGENPVTELTVTVEIRDAEGDLVETGTATVNADGSWSYIPKLDIADGNYFVEVSATDLANNTSTDTGGLAIDTTPPALLTIDFNDTGLFDDDGITSDGVIKLSNFEANSIWFYSLNGGNTWIQGEGKGFVIPEGVYVEDAIQIKQTDSFGNSTTQAIEVYKVDKTAPEFPTATLAFDTGSSATDGKTSNGLINVTDLESGSTWKYSLDGGLNWVEGTGTTFTLLDGSYAAGQIQIEQKDIAGNTSISRLGEIIVDQTLSTPVLSIKDLGSNTSDNLTSDPKVYVSDIEAGSIWEYSLDGGQTWTLGTGNSFEAGLFGQNTSYSSNQIQVKQTDVYGNERIGKLSNAVTFDTLRHQLDMKLSDDSGSIKNDFITNNGEVIVSNLPIDLDYWQYSVNGSVFINGTGNSFVLPEGVYEESDIQIVMFDKAGNKSAIWNAETWVVDTTPPVLQIDALPVGYITSSPVFEGTGNSGDVVTVTISNGSNPQSVTAIVDASGKWSVTSPKLDKGAYTVVASTEDLAGNTTTVVGSNKIIIDLPVGFTFDLSNDSGIYGDGITNDNNVGIGNLDTSKTWEYSIDGGKTWTNGPDSSFRFDLPDGAYADGSILIRQPHILNDYFVYEFGGIYTVDTTVSIPTFTLTNDNGVSTTDGITSNGLIKLVGTGEKGATVSIYNGNTKLGETIVKEDGTWSFNATDPLAVGIHKIGVSQVDIAGNHSFEATKNIDVRINIDAKQNIENFDIKYQQKNATVLDKQIVNINASGQVHSIELGTTPDKGVMQFTINVDSNTYTANQSQGTVVLGMVWQHASIKKWNGTTYVEDATLTQAFKTLLNPNYPANPTSTQTGKLHGEINFFASNIAAGKYRLDFDTDVIKLSDGGVTGPNTTGDVTNGILNYSTNLSKDQSDLTGNILTNDIKDQHTTINSVIGVGTTTITGDTYNVTGKYGILSINKLTGAYTYKLTDQSANAIGKVETFSYKIANNVSESTSNLNIQIGSSTLLVGASKPTVMNVSDNVGAVTATVVSNGSNTDDSTPTFVIDTPRTESNAGLITWSKVNVKVDGVLVDTISINQNSGQVVWTPKTPLSAGQHNVVFSLTGATSSGATYESPLTSNFSMNVTGNAFVNSWNVNNPGTQKFDITSSDTIVDTNRLDYTGMQSGDVLSGDSNVTNAFNLSQYSDAVLDFKVTIKTPLSTSGATYQVEVILQKFVNGVWIEIEKKPYSYAGASSAVTASTEVDQEI